MHISQKTPVRPVDPGSPVAPVRPALRQDCGRCLVVGNHMHVHSYLREACSMHYVWAEAVWDAELLQSHLCCLLSQQDLFPQSDLRSWEALSSAVTAAIQHVRHFRSKQPVAHMEVR